MLAATHLIGFGAGSSGRSYSYNASSADATTLTVYTFSSQDLGLSGQDRIVSVLITAERASGTPSSITTVTIGGVSATSRISQTSDSGIAAIYTAAVPNGSTGDIVVTFGQDQGNCAISIISMYGLSDAGAAIAGGTGSSTTDNGTIALTTVSGAIVLGCAIVLGSIAFYTWTGLVELYDATTDRTRTSAAAYASSTSLNVSANPSAGTFFVAVAAAFK